LWKPEHTGLAHCWEGFTHPTQGHEIEHPHLYTLYFRANGSYEVMADCNRASGSYITDGSKVRLEAGAATLADCGPDSLSDEFIQNLGAAAIHFFKDGKLFIDLSADGGIMQFGPIISGRVTSSESVTLPDEAVVKLRVEDTDPADASAATIGEQIIEAEGRQLPIDYVVVYDTPRIENNHSYSAAVRIEDANGNLLYTSDTNTPVITRGHPVFDVEIPVVPVLSPGATPEPIEDDPPLVLGEPDFFDGFDSYANWSKNNNDCYANDIQNGLFYMTAKGLKGIPCLTFSSQEIQNFYLQTQLQNPGVCLPDDNFGMVFRAPGNQRGYLFGVTCDGRIGLWNWDGKNAYMISPWSTSSALNAGPNARNRIGVAVYGEEFLLYANGRLVTRVENSDYQGAGKIGYYVFTSGEQAFTIKFDDLAYWLLDEPYVPANTSGTP
jgi:putative lipoprotein